MDETTFRTGRNPDGTPLQHDAIAGDQPRGEWVMLEIFGHRRHWGLLTEIERFGTKLARIDEFVPDTADPVATHFYGGGSIFSVTPVTEETARKQVAWQHPRPAVQSLPPQAFDPDFDEIEELDADA